MTIPLQPGEELVLEAQFDPRWKSYGAVRGVFQLFIFYGPSLAVLSSVFLFGFDFQFEHPDDDLVTQPDDFISRLSEIFSNRILISVVAVVSLLILKLWWVGAYFKTLKCCLTTRSVVFHQGVFHKTEKTIPLTRIQDLGVYQGPLMRKFDILGLRVETAGQSGRGGEANLVGLVDAREFRDRVLNQCHSLEFGTPES